MNTTSRILGDSIDHPTNTDLLRAFLLVWEAFDAAGFTGDVTLNVKRGSTLRRRFFVRIKDFKEFVHEQEVEEYANPFGEESAQYHGSRIIVRNNKSEWARLKKFHEIVGLLASHEKPGIRPLDKPLGDVYDASYGSGFLAFTYFHTLDWVGSGPAGRLILT